MIGTLIVVALPSIVITLLGIWAVRKEDGKWTT